MILTCVGSTGKTTLRPAASSDAVVFEGPHEIVSLTGTLCASKSPLGAKGGQSSHHLHMSVSDGVTCSVKGGHLLEGTIVRTTAEVAVGELPGLLFDRVLDPRTGFNELSVAQNTRLPPFSGLFPPPGALASFSGAAALAAAMGGEAPRVKRKYTKRAPPVDPNAPRVPIPGAYRCIKSPGGRRSYKLRARERAIPRGPGRHAFLKTPPRGDPPSDCVPAAPGD